MPQANTKAYWAHSYVQKKEWYDEYCPWDHIHNTSFTLDLANAPNKLIYRKGLLAMDKHSSLLGLFIGSKKIIVSYWQHTIFFITSERAQWANLLHYTRFERLAMDKYSCLLGPFICLEKIECYEYCPWDHIHNTSFTLELANAPNKLICYITLGWKGAMDKHSSLLGPFICFKEN